MRFTPRYNAVTAAHVTLDGVELTVVSAGGRAHCVPAEFFALFFEPTADVEKPAADRPDSIHSPTKPRALSPGLPKVEPPLKGSAPSGFGMGTSDAVLKVIGESAMTGTEVADRALLLMGLDCKDTSERAKVQSMMNYLRKQNRIVRRECQETHLDKWYLIPKATDDGQPKA